MGKCPECGAWNSITEVKLPPKSKAAPGGDFSGFAGAAGEGETEILSEIPLAELPRFTTGFREFDRVLGGGIVPGACRKNPAGRRLDGIGREGYTESRKTKEDAV